MSSGNITLTKNHPKQLNEDFELLLNSTNDVHLKNRLLAEIAKEIRLSTVKKWLKILLLVAFITSQIYAIPFLNWNASAVGRITMIKMLKFWDWRYLYNVECLIERKVHTFEHMESSMDIIEEDCSFCEVIGKKWNK